MGESVLSFLLSPLMIWGVAAAFLVIVAVVVVRARRKKARRKAERRRRKAEEMRRERERHEAEQSLPPVPLRTYPMPVVDVSEERVFDQLEDLVHQSVLGHRALPHMSLDAFLYAGDKGITPAQEQHWADLLSSREVDFLVVDGDWNPVVAIVLERDALLTREEDGVEAQLCDNAGVVFMKVSPGGLTDAQIEDVKGYLASGQAIAAQ
jgi:hypothetical protein